MKANPSGPEGLARGRGVRGVARLGRSTHYALRRAPCIRSLTRPTRLTRNAQTGSYVSARSQVVQDVTGSARSCYNVSLMRQSFQAIALVGNANDLRVAECMLGLANHFYAQGLRPLVDPGVGLAFRPDSIVACPEATFATRADLIIAIGGDGTLAVCCAAGRRAFGAAARHQPRPLGISDRREPPIDVAGRRYRACRALQRGSALAAVRTLGEEGPARTVCVPSP